MLMVLSSAGMMQAKDIQLPQPRKQGYAFAGGPEQQAVCQEMSEEPLSVQTLSDLLWAADGVNRKDGRRTALG